jgi:hypothetical protein
LQLLLAMQLLKKQMMYDVWVYYWCAELIVMMTFWLKQQIAAQMPMEKDTLNLIV